MNNVKSSLWVTGLILAVGLLFSAWNPVSTDKRSVFTDTLVTNINGKGLSMVLDFKAGKYHNYPTMALWVEDMEGNFLQPLFVTKSAATGVYGNKSTADGVWINEPGEVSRPATLPYFLHKRNIQAPDGTYLPTPGNPIPDAYTGATPKASFHLNTKTDEPVSGKIRILFEVNQPWDWNSFWNNKKYPGDFNYKTSCQPAVVYAVTVDLNNLMDYYVLNPIGHSHYSGSNGLLYSDLTTFSTALNIFDAVIVKIINR